MNIPELFIRMVNQSITAGIVILAVLCARELLRRLRVSSRYICLLWIIPILRLVCPVSFSSVASLFNLPVFDHAVQTEAGLEYLPEELSEAAAGTEPAEAREREIREGSFGMSQVRQDVGEAINYYGGHVFELSARESCREADIHPAEGAPVDFRKAALYALTGIWLAGIAVILGRNLRAYILIRKKTTCAARLPAGPGDVYECEGIRTPFAMGLLRVRIYIPYHISEREREYVLLHERCHIRHHDLWTRLLACILQAVYWYNPLVWIAVRCMERDMEMRCDEYVLSRLGEKIRYDYSMSLLSYATGGVRQPMGTTAFGESGTGKRVNHVLKYKKTGVFVAIAAVLAIAAISVVCLTDRSPEEETGEKSQAAKKTWFWGQQELKAELSERTAVAAMSLVGRSVLPLPAETEEGKYGRCFSCIGDHSYFLVRSLYTEQETVYELQIFDGDSKEWSKGVLDKELLGEDGTLYSMFAVSDQELVYLVAFHDADMQWTAYYAVHMDRAGKELKRVDLLPVCQELDLRPVSPELVMLGQDILPTNICVDRSGNYYIMSHDSDRVVAADEEGKLLGSQDIDVDQNQKGRYRPMTAGPDGGILIQGRHQSGITEWIYLEGTRKKRLGSVRVGYGSDMDQIIPLDKGICYYITTEKRIYRIDGATGTAEYLFNANGIMGTLGDVAVNGEDEVLLFDEGEDKVTAYVLSRTKETHMGEGGEVMSFSDPLRVVDITRSYISQTMNYILPVFMANYPEYAIELQNVTNEDFEAAHTRVWNELIAGKGPDLFIINPEDLPVLWEKGILMDLRELISPETLEQFYPALLATGTIEGSLAGVAEYYMFDTMVTSTDIWQEEHWTVEDVVSMLEEQRTPHALDEGWRYAGDSLLAYRLVCEDISHSPFIDLEAGTCSFDSELFVRLLKVCKQYPYDPGNRDSPYDYLTPYQRLLEGESLAVYHMGLNLLSYVSIRQLMGERYNEIGIPGAVNSGPRIRPSAYVVVNKDCKNKEAAAAYLEYMLNTELMWDFRRDYKDTIDVVKGPNERWGIAYGQNVSLLYLGEWDDPAIKTEEMPEIYEEWLKYSEEYFAYMESLECAAYYDYQRIIAIITEEMDSYFEGGKSAENVAGVIQSRVQIYLDERK